jgi:hypothetical protein
LKLLITLSEREISQKPKQSYLSCLVPGCNKTWLLSGPSQGFMRASAQHHAFTHWEKYHTEKKHPRAIWKDSDGIDHVSIDFCNCCKRASENEYLRKKKEKK